MPEITILQDLPDEVNEFMALKNGVYKNILYARLGSFYDTSNIFEDETRICFAYKQMSIKKGRNGYFLKDKTKKGFTFNKSTKKLNMWFGGNVGDISNYLQAFKHFKIDWIESYLMVYLTKGGMEKILSGKITNPIDFCKNYLKSIKAGNVSAVLFYKVLKTKTINKNFIIKGLYLAKYPNHFLEYCLNSPDAGVNPILNDTLDQASILEEKYNFKWSPKRMDSVHNEWTKKIMEVEAISIPDYTVEYENTLFNSLPKEFELLNTQKRVFEEGKMMNHCLYTNYWEKIKRKTYVAFHVILNGEKATFGLNLDNGKLSYNQLFGIRNSRVSNEMREMCMSHYPLTYGTNNNVEEFIF